MKTSINRTELAKRIEGSLDVIGILADVLLNNGSYKGDPDDVDNPAQINDRGESGVQRAIQIIAEIAHQDFCRLATDLEIPQ